MKKGERRKAKGKRRKGNLSAVVLLITLLAVGAWAGAPRDSLKRKGKSERIVIGFIAKSTHPYWQEMQLGASKTAKQLSKNIEVKWFLPLNEDVQAQVRTVENYIALNVDGIAFAASDPNAMVVPIQKALKAGIPCIAVDSDAPNSGRLAYVGTDNYTAGKAGGKKMAELLKGKGKVAIGTGSLTAMNSRQRMGGFKDGLKEAKAQIEVVETFVDNEDALRAQQLATQALQKYPDLSGFFGVFAFNGPAASRAFAARGASGKVKIVCFDTTPEHMKLIKEGKIDATVGQRPFVMGVETVKLLYRILTEGADAALKDIPKRGKPSSPYLDTGTDVVTKATLEDYRKQVKKLGIPVQGW